MFLWQIETTMMGESYIRAYAWAGSQEEAIQLFKEKNPEYADKIQTVRNLFHKDATAFCSVASDSGFDFV